MQSVQVYEGNGIEPGGPTLSFLLDSVDQAVEQLNWGCNWASTWNESGPDVAIMADLLVGRHADVKLGGLNRIIDAVWKLQGLVATPVRSHHPAFESPTDLYHAMARLLRTLHDLRGFIQCH